jgi:hypothetical protein
MIEYNQNSYFDDRLFVVHLCRGKIESGNDGTVETTIFHDEDADNLVWCLATYRNCENYPLVSLNHFETKDDALKYASLIEPTVPLISLNGQSPNPPLSYPDYLRWKSENDFRDYDYKKTYLPGGKNHRETVIQLKEHFFEGIQKVNRMLGSGA